MSREAIELKFLATPEKGEVSALLIRPGGASHLLVLGHGASTNMRHATLQTIAERMADVGIATFRYNFPYMEHGKGRDSQAVCTATVRSAVAAARECRCRSPAPGRRSLLRRTHDLHGGLGASPSMASTAWSSSPSPCISPASRTRSARSTWAPSRSRCSSSAAPATSWRTWICSRPVCKQLGSARRSTRWTPPTTASARSNAPARARRTSSSRWPASSGSGRLGYDPLQADHFLVGSFDGRNAHGATGRRARGLLRTG